jgi:hypothetical protein
MTQPPQKAWQLLSGPEKWTQGGFSRDSNDNLTEESHPSAVKFCIVGAIFKSYGAADAQMQIKKIQKHHYPARHLSQWNDDPSRTFQEVWAVLRRLDV